MFTNTNMIMALHKSREHGLIQRAESSILQGQNRPHRATLEKRFIQPITSVLVHLGLK